jgi:hypothetical protein
LEDAYKKKELTMTKKRKKNKEIREEVIKTKER